MNASHMIAAITGTIMLMTPALADTQKRSSSHSYQVAQKSKAMSLRRAYRKGYIVKKRNYPKSLIARARRSDDEIDECMKNPDNSHIPYIERLGACFCLAIDNKLKGCQTAD